jgi:hypothetical protein
MAKLSNWSLSKTVQFRISQNHRRQKFRRNEHNDRRFRHWSRSIITMYNRFFSAHHMTIHVALVFLLTFLIHLMSMLSYAIRIAGVRTGRLAVSLALFNILLLVSRTSNTFQAPLLAKHVEQNILAGGGSGIESDLRWLLIAAALASVVGLVLIPTFQRLFGVAIESLSRHRSMPRLLLRVMSFSSWRYLKSSIAVPQKENVTRLEVRQVPWAMLIYNTWRARC